MSNTRTKLKSTSPRVSTSVDKVGLCVLITTIIIIVTVVIVGIFVRFLVEENLARVILISLIFFLIILGITSLVFLELRKKSVTKRNKIVMKNGQYHTVSPTAPPEDSSWEYSNRATISA